MKYAMDVKVDLEPTFNNLVHTDWWGSPCRVGPTEEGTPEFERRVGEEQFKIWHEELQNNLDLTRYNLMDPVCMEFDESFAMRDSEFGKLVSGNHWVDLYLIIYRVLGVERLDKPVSMINLGPTPIDLVGYYGDIELEAYMAHNYEEYNRILTCLQVRKAVAGTKILVLSNSEQTPASINTGCCDLVGPFARYGIRHNHIDSRWMFNYFDEMLADEGIHQEAKALMEGTDKVDITEEHLYDDLQYFHAVRRMMERYDCNTFITPCKELCAGRLPQKNKYVPCIAHPLNKDDGIPPACEESLAVWMAIMMMICPTRWSVFMGSPVLVLAGSGTLEQLGMPKLLTQPGQIFGHDVLETHHAMPVRRMRGFDQPEQKYGLAHFTAQGWDAHYHVDMTGEEGQVVAFGHLSHQDTRMMVAVGHTLGYEFRPAYYSPAVYYEVEGGAREFRQALVRGGYGHHQAIIYGNHVEELQELGEIAGFEVEVFH